MMVLLYAVGVVPFAFVFMGRFYDASPCYRYATFLAA
jgi:hypothetical protein